MGQPDGAEWTPDSKGFFYARYPQPEEGAAFTSLNANMKVYYHRVGTAQSADVLVYERPDQPDWGFQLSVSEDGRYLIITVWSKRTAIELLSVFSANPTDCLMN